MADYLDREHDKLHCGYISNFNIGRCLYLSATENGRGMVEINPTPINPSVDCEDLRDFMEEIMCSWAEQLDTLPMFGAFNDNDNQFEFDFEPLDN